MPYRVVLIAREKLGGGRHICPQTLDMCSLIESSAKKGLESRMLQLHDSLLVAAANVRQQPVSVIWNEWLVKFLEDTRQSRDAADRCPSLMDLLNTSEYPGNDASADGFKYDPLKLLLLKYAAACGFALMGNGRILSCLLQERPKEHKPFRDCELWAIKGCPHYLILRRKKQHKYEILGRTAEIKDEVDIFSKHRSVRINLV